MPNNNDRERLGVGCECVRATGRRLRATDCSSVLQKPGRTPAKFASPVFFEAAAAIDFATPGKCGAVGAIFVRAGFFNREALVPG